MNRLAAALTCVYLMWFGCTVVKLTAWLNPFPRFLVSFTSGVMVAVSALTLLAVLFAKGVRR